MPGSSTLGKMELSHSVPAVGRPRLLLLLLITALLGLAGPACGGDPATDGDSRTGQGSSVPHGSNPGGSAGSGGLEAIPGGQTDTPTPMLPTKQFVDAGVEGECASIKQTAEVTRGPVDIVWIIDGSASMLDEIAAVQTNITAFSDMIGAAGIDHHVVMLATGDVAAGTGLGADPAHYLYVPSPVDSHNALQLLLDQYVDYQAFLRPEAALHFVLVSDDESWLAGADFKTMMETKAGKPFIFHAIASEDVMGLPCVGACGLPIVCGGFAPGIQYYWLADATGGQKISICIADWSMVFVPLQEAVIASAPLPCNYPIPTPPGGASFDENKVNLEFVSTGAAAATVFPRAADEAGCGTELAWFYPPEGPTELRLCPAACTAVTAGGTIDIALGCDTVVVE